MYPSLLHVSPHVFVQRSYVEGCSKNENKYFHAKILPVLITHCFVVFSIWHLTETIKLYVKNQYSPDRFQHLSKYSGDEDEVLLEKEIRKKRTSGTIYL